MLEKYLPDGNERAVSPVIGVVLMVGIVVALGAVVGAAVLGLGVGVGDTAPNAQFDASYNGSALNVEHVAGDTVDGERLDYTLAGSDVADADYSGFSGEITAGDSAAFTTANAGDDFTIQWSAENGETSSVLFEYEIPA